VNPRRRQSLHSLPPLPLLAQAIWGWMRPPRPQSVPAILIEHEVVNELQQWPRRVERVCLIAVLIAILAVMDTADAVQYALVVIRFLQPSTQAHTAQPHALWRAREHPVADTSQARQIDCQA
jgi:hypothetical protein